MKLSEHPAFSGVSHLDAVSAANVVKALSDLDPDIRGALSRGDVASAVAKAFSSRWPTINKAVSGGFQFILAADNGANYAELWSSGNPQEANWYAVTGADIHEVSDIRKGEPFSSAFEKFMIATVRKADCKPCAKG